MKELETLLVDGREAVAGALAPVARDLGCTLRSGYARGSFGGDTVIWGEYANVSTDCPVADRLEYQVTVHAGDLDRLRALCAGVNRALTGLGLKRTYTSPDGFDQDHAEAYTQTLRFGRKVDKRTMRLVD